MNQKFISNSHRIFLVKFRNSSEQFIVQGRQLYDIIKNFDGQIEFIKMSETSEIKFTIREVKTRILKQFSWDTEVLQYFLTLPYFSTFRKSYL